MTAIELAKFAAGILDAKKAEDISAIKIDEISSLADYFILTTGTSSTHVKALADEVEMKLKAEGITPAGIEGYRSNSWILLDYQYIVIHIFTAEGREFYDLDRLWKDGKKIELELLPN